MRGASSRMLVALAACAVVVAAGTVTSAKEHEEQGHGGSKKKHSHHGHHSDHGKHYANGHHKFDDHDREIAQSWCTENREHLPAGFRPDDRLAPELDARLRIGSVLDVDLRSRIHPLPDDLLKRLPPPPVDLRYVAIGGHVAIVDAVHRLHDLLPRPPLPF